MRKEVNLVTYILIGLLFSSLSSAMVITPQKIMITDYASAQEQIITILNDDFNPIGCNLAPTYTSLYLAEYIYIEPAQFLLQPGEQQNVKVSTTFPKDYFPQTHNIFVPIYPDSEEGFTITFRPSGTQQQSLSLEQITTDFNDKSLTITMDLVNKGNVVLFITPQLFVSQNTTIIKNITYPQPVVIMPGEIFPLTLRQDNSEFEPGEYNTIIQAQYKADTVTAVTNQEIIPFSINKEIIEEENSWWVYIAAILSGLIITSSIVWSSLHSRKRKQKKKEKHIVPQNNYSEVTTIKQNIYSAKEELMILTKDIKKLVDEADTWVKTQ